MKLFTRRMAFLILFVLLAALHLSCTVVQGGTGSKRPARCPVPASGNNPEAVFTWELGRLRTGGDPADSDRCIRTKAIGRLSQPVTFRLDKGYHMIVHYYTAPDAAFHDTAYTSETAAGGTSGWQSETCTVDAGVYFRVSIGYGTIATDAQGNEYLADKGKALTTADVDGFAAHARTGGAETPEAVFVWETGRLRTGGDPADSDRSIRTKAIGWLSQPVTFRLDKGYHMIVHYYSSPDAAFHDTAYTSETAAGGTSGWQSETCTVDAGVYFRVSIGYGTIATDAQGNEYLAEKGKSLTTADVDGFAAHARYGGEAEVPEVWTGEWECGTLRSGGDKADNSKRIRLKERARFSQPQTFYIRSGYRMIVYYYASADTVNDGYRDTSRDDGGTSGWQSGPSYTVEGATYFNICIAKVSEGGSYTADIEEYTAAVSMNAPPGEEETPTEPDNQNGETEPDKQTDEDRTNALASMIGALTSRLAGAENLLVRESVGEWELGGFRSGGDPMDNSKQIRLKKRVMFDEPKTFRILPGYRMNVFYYTSADPAESPYRDTSRSDGGTSDWQTGESFTLEAGVYVNICIARVSEGGVYTADIDEFTSAVFVDASTPLTAAVVSLQDEQSDNARTRRLVTDTIGHALPDHLATYVNARRAAVEEKALAVGNHGDVFAFFTDYHYTVSDQRTYGYSYLPDMLRELGVRKVVFGGDVLQNHNGNGQITGREEALSILRQFRREFGSFTFYPLFGNHDTNSYAADPSDVLTESEIYEALYRETGMEERTVLQPEMYYYFDNQPQKIRYICLNTHTTVTEWAADEKQAAWLVRTLAEVPAGYHIVVMTHMFFEVDAAEVPTHDSRIYVTSVGRSIQTIVDAYANRNSGRWKGVAYDFSACEGKVACILCGHVHNDHSIISEAGYPIITTTCEAQWGSHQELTGVTRGSSATGTVAEHAFDVFCIDTSASTIQAVRIGSGRDRMWRYGSDAAEITERTVAEIAIADNPTRMTYTVGESFRPEGLALLATYSDQTTQRVTEGFTCTPSEPFTEAGEQAVTVTYEGASAVLYVTVSPGVVNP